MPVPFDEQKAILAAISEFQAGNLDALRLAERVAGLASRLDPEHQDDDLTAFVAVLSETDKYLVQDSLRVNRSIVERRPVIGPISPLLPRRCSAVGARPPNKRLKLTARVD